MLPKSSKASLKGLQLIASAFYNTPSGFLALVVPFSQNFLGLNV